MISEEGGARNNNLDSYRERITNFSNEFDLGLFIYIVKRSLIWIVLCILLALAAAYIYLRYTAPTYESKAIIQLSQHNNARKVLDVTDITEDKSIQADVELIRSKFFVGMALDRLPLTVSYYYNGQILTKEFYTESPYTLEDLVVADTLVLDRPIFCTPSAESKVKVSYSVEGRNFAELFDMRSRIVTPHFSCRLKLSEGSTFATPDPDGTHYFVINNKTTLISRYSKQLSVQILDANAKTVVLSCKDHNSILARDIPQAMAQTFIDYDVERNRASAEAILRFIETQKDTVFQQLKESEMLLQSFKQDNQVADLERLTPIYLERNSEYENEILNLRVEESLLNEIEKSTNQTPNQIEVYNLIPLLVGTSYEQTLSALVRALQDLVTERDKALFEETPENEEIKGLEVRINIQKKLILESINTLRKRFNERRLDYEERIAEFEQRFMSLPEKELAFARIQRLFNINEKYYTQLLEKDIEYRISNAGFVPENRILESAALPRSPIAPDRNVVLLSYLLTGIIISFLIVLIRYILHDNITSLIDIARQSNASIGILGMVPRYKKEIPISQLLVDKNPKSLIAESFRSVRTNLQFVDNTPGPKIIAVTSTISGEGKTFVAINLAGIISFSGKRVIVLDLDMRKPKIHLGFGVENIKGMSTLLISKDTLEDCIQNSALENLDFITAGPIPPNPSELIISPRMNSILEELKLSYDVILIDNPPVGLVTDGIAMIQRADYPIYIFRADYSKKAFVQNVDRLINENKITRMSTILNGVDIERNKYGYNYGYGYGYGYGYTQGYGYGYGYYEDRGRDKRTKGFFAKLFGG